MSSHELIAIREAARRLHVSDTAIRKAIADGRLTPPADDDRNPDNGRPRLRWPLARDEFVRNSETSKRSHVGRQGGASRAKDYAAKPEVRLPTSDRMDEQPDIGGDLSDVSGASGGSGPKSGRDGAYTKARAAREVYQAKLAKLEYEQKTGALVSADEVKVAWFKHITAAKTRILGIPAACKSRYADLPLAAIAIIDQVCREALEDLASGRD